MYLIGFSARLRQPDLAMAATALFVVVSQLKINVTNAYAGSLAWSNFFARLTHSHPGRVVWVVFNTLIALLLMELNVFQALGQVLGLYSNIAISWMVAVVADLVINKPLGLSPPGIEFKRGHLYDINPVGVGAMGIASLLSIAAFVGVLGPTPALRLVHRAGQRAAGLAADRLGDRRPLLPGAPAGAGTRDDIGRGRHPNARSANATTRARTWRTARPITARSARCAARSTPAATTCASRRPAWPRSGTPCCAACCRLPPCPTWKPASAITCC